jgi:bifunctional DNase/RNase
MEPLAPSASERWRWRGVLAVLTLAFIAVGGWLVWTLMHPSPPSAPESSLSPTAHEMVVADLVRERASGSVVLVLQEKDGDRLLLLTIGDAEARAILLPLVGEAPPRPLTHDLMARTLAELGVTVARVVVTDLRESTYYAQLVLRVGEREVAIDSRPSDAVALALRARAPIYAEASVLERAATDTAPSPPAQPF